MQDYPFFRLSIRLAVLNIILLFFAVPLLAQSPVFNNIGNQFDLYRREVLQEKVFMHTDKEFYMAGETLWFKIYNVDGTFNKPLVLSKVAYVDIIDAGGRPVLQAKAYIDQGSGKGSVYLPFSIASNNYKIRAYTSLMRNIGPESFFEKKITIVNSLGPGNVAAPENQPGYDIRFFPEGGNLVQGITSTVAFRVADHTGSGIRFKGAIINQNNDTVVRFNPLKFGIGRLSFTPAANQQYKAVIITEAGRSIAAELPRIYANGYVMSITNFNASQLRVTVNSNSGSATAEQAVYLFAHTRQVTKISERGSINAKGYTEFIIDKSKLGEGVSAFTLFNDAGQPVCERLYFIRPAKNLLLQAASDQQVYASRKKVTIAVDTRNAAGQPVSADMSVSVLRLDSLQPAAEQNIFNYLWLSSDLKGNIESPGYYVESKDASVDEATDNLMLTHGWRKFGWEDILQYKPGLFKFLPEINGHIINGKVTDKEGKPAAHIQTYLSIPGKSPLFYASRSNALGEVKFYTRDFYGSNEIIVQADPRTDSLYHVTLSSPFASEFSSGTLPAFSPYKAAYTNQLLAGSINMQLQNIFTPGKPADAPMPPAPVIFYGQADAGYLLADYTRFPTIDETIREYVHESGIRTVGGIPRLRVLTDEASKVFFEEEPLVLLDGIPVFDHRKIIAYDPGKIKKLEIVTRRYILGNLTFGGILSFTTYNGNFQDYQPDPRAVIIDYEGLQKARQFYSPVYETQDQLTGRKPDFRSVLLWAPDIKTGAEGKKQISFYTSDQKGVYMVVLQGITADGSPGNNYFTFEVKNPL